MSQESSERKEFAASSRKLRKMREKGQFAQSRDLMTFFVATAATVYLVLAMPYIMARLIALFDLALRHISGGFTDRLMEMLILNMAQVLLLTLPMFLVVTLTTLIGGGVIGGGIRFATDMLIPKFERINPASGAKRIFGKQALMQFVMSLLKVTILVGITCFFIYFALGDLNRLGHRFEAGFGTLVTLLPQLVAIMMGLMMILGLVDYLIQRALFMENAKMTRTEVKNESKEQEGDPLRRSRRKEIARENVENPTGARFATFAIQYGTTLVAYRWLQGETPAPILIAKTNTAEGVALIKENMPARAPVLRDKLSIRLFDGQIGGGVAQEDINPLAQLMSRNGLYS